MGIRHISGFSHAAPPVSTVAAILLTAALNAPIGCAYGETTANDGEAIYRHGVLASGKPVEAVRDAGMRIQRAEAACINCHRRSGFGAKEGFINIPPVTGRYLFLAR